MVADPGDGEEADECQWGDSGKVTQCEQHTASGEKRGGEQVLLPARQVSDESDRLAGLEERSVWHQLGSRVRARSPRRIAATISPG
jgi:hypothetical protein